MILYLTQTEMQESGLRDTSDLIRNYCVGNALVAVFVPVTYVDLGFTDFVLIDINHSVTSSAFEVTTFTNDHLMYICYVKIINLYGVYVYR